MKRHDRGEPRIHPSKRKYDATAKTKADTRQPPRVHAARALELFESRQRTTL
jgi:hypothetical protein